MSFLVAPPGHNDDPVPEGDVEQLLRAFYRMEMPNPWPSCAATAERTRVLPFPAPTTRRPLFTRSRLALAASVALLLGGVGLLSDKFDTGAAEQPGLRIIDMGATHEPAGTNLNSHPYMTDPRIDRDEIKISGGFLEEPSIGP